MSQPPEIIRASHIERWSDTADAFVVGNVRIQQVAPGQHAAQLAILPEYRKALVRVGGRLGAQPGANFREFLRVAQADHLPAACISNADLVEIVGGVVRWNAHAAAGDLLGHDRVAHHQARNQIRRGTGAEQGQQAVDLVRGFEGEHHRGEESA